MKKKLLASLLLLTGLGVALTLYLPPINTATAPKYNVDQTSLKKPISADDLVLRVAPEKNSQFGLQLGLYPSLSQAKTIAQKMVQKDTIKVIATQYDQQPWYILLLGPFTTLDEALSAQKGLNKVPSVTSSPVRWPESLVSKKSSTANKSSPE